MTHIDESANEQTVVEYDRQTSVPASYGVIEAMSTFRACEPLELEPLFYRVDTDALDDLIASASAADSRLRVSFDFEQCTVEVTERKTTIASQAGENGSYP